MDALDILIPKTCFNSEKYRCACTWANLRKDGLWADDNVLHFDAHKDELVGLPINVHGFNMRTQMSLIK